MFATPPPGTGVFTLDETSSTIVVFIFFPSMAERRTEFGLLIIVLVKCILASSVRKTDGLERADSSNGCSFAGLPMRKGVILISAISGPVGIGFAVPCAMTVVPCGIGAIRTTVGPTLGCSVFGTVAQIPGSR